MDEKNVQTSNSNGNVSKYPRNSKAAALNRLKNGSDEFSDKWQINKENIIKLYAILFIPAILLYFSCRSGGSILGLIGFLIVMLALVNYPLYFLYLSRHSYLKMSAKFLITELLVFLFNALDFIPMSFLSI